MLGHLVTFHFAYPIHTTADRRDSSAIFAARLVAQPNEPGNHVC